MALNEDDIRQEAWKQFIDARGTYTIFTRRAASLKRWMQARDFSAIAIPVVVAFVATTDFVEKLGSFKAVALAILAIAGLIQVLLSGWSLIARWDEERSYSLRALRDAYDMEAKWREIAKKDVPDLVVAYEAAKTQQRAIDSHDIGKEISESERQIGLRAGLKEIPRACIECKKIPATIDIPKIVNKRCPVCGGEI
ncbi:MAG TPA: mobilome CxxCx(11)CxxC protein [Bradyrhizobium sp.]|nr:mobilome CxxCx(11)CxxC protein [Bradyrhizobium sp.]